MTIDTYTKDILIEQYNLHKNYVVQRKRSSLNLNVSFRFPGIPEDISENIIKFINHKIGDKTSSWNCDGDLFSEKYGKQECKCFTSDGPLSFSPTSDWNVIYFLDATKWIDNKFKLYMINCKKTSVIWSNIKVNKNQTFQDQCLEKRRPHINWKTLYPQVEEYCNLIFDGTFNDIFE